MLISIPVRLGNGDSMTLKKSKVIFKKKKNLFESENEQVQEHVQPRATGYFMVFPKKHKTELEMVHFSLWSLLKRRGPK